MKNLTHPSPHRRGKFDSSPKRGGQRWGFLNVTCQQTQVILQDESPTWGILQSIGTHLETRWVYAMKPSPEGEGKAGVIHY
ncbi:MAG: hypothetical protein A2142_09025 [candidate division Zixibacteria bacterium RBG_16_48_11]|nr:MAG: hypothetical protein A2142_09025 [candidate division Zixibacteria bacterium RBG_16_48_11]